MSLSFLRDSIIKELQDRVDTHTNSAINIRPRLSDGISAAMSTDEYAMHQIDTLSSARAYAAAINIVLDAYTKMTRPELKEDEQKELKSQQAGPKEPLY